MTTILAPNIKILLKFLLTKLIFIHRQENFVILWKIWPVFSCFFSVKIFGHFWDNKNIWYLHRSSSQNQEIFLPSEFCNMSKEAYVVTP